MLVYKITFVKNKVDSCRIIKVYPQFETDMMYESHNNRLIYALVKAENEEEALNSADRLIMEYESGNRR